MSVEKSIQAAFGDPSSGLRELDRLDAEESLIDFIQLMWPVLEPGREFVDGWAVRAICDHLERVSRGEITRLLINVPPGCMKSLTTCVFWPAWEWIKDPSRRYIATAYAEQLTLRDNMKFRRLVNSDLYRGYWGDRFELDPDERSKGKLGNKQTGWKLATSVGGAATGERADVVVVDDPHNVKDGESEAKRMEALMYFTEVLPTRINDAVNSAMVVIMQRIHEEDVSGLILAELMQDWEHLCLPMRFEEDQPHRTTTGFVDPRTVDGDLLWPGRFPEPTVVRDERVLSSVGGPYAVAGQMQQRPAPRGGGMFKRDDFQVIDRKDVPVGGQTVRGWDLAGAKDKRAAYTASVKIRRIGVDLFIMDVLRERLGPTELERAIRAAADADGIGVQQSLPQDPGQAGLHQKKALAGVLAGHDVHFSLESGDKEDRAKPLAAQVGAGNVYLVRAPWNNAFLAEAATFPAGKWKDQVDAATRAYARLIVKRTPLIGHAPKVIG